VLKELDIFGVYISPVFIYLLASALPWLALRWLLTITRAYRFIWHTPLFNTALYILLFAVIYYLFNLDPRPAPLSFIVHLIHNIFA
jgi:hypothetical protein